MSKKQCNTCGHSYESTSHRSLYCSEDCGSLFKYMNAVESLLIKIKLTDASARSIKSNMFGVSNIIRIRTSKKNG